MQLSVFFLLLLCGHLVGDFYLQPFFLVKGKAKSLLFLSVHVLVYVLSIGLFLLPYLSVSMWWFVPVLLGSHFVVDWTKIKLLRGRWHFAGIRPVAFVLDQMIHIVVLGVIAYIYAMNYQIACNPFGIWLGNVWVQTQGISPEEALRYLLIFLVIGKPANILIKEINHPTNIQIQLPDAPLLKTQPKEPEYKNAGGLIGVLERLLVVMMALLGQYAAVGLIFTAKSITRYDKIVKEPAFAEYYLVGTLLSVLIAIISVLLFGPVVP